MKANVIYTSGLFKFLPNGWPIQPSYSGAAYQDTPSRQRYEFVKTQALKDAVVFADQRAIKWRIWDDDVLVQPPVKDFDDWQPTEGQTFYIEGVEIESGVYKIVAILPKPESSAHSYTEGMETPNDKAIYLKGFYTPEQLKTYITQEPCKVSGETQEEKLKGLLRQMWTEDGSMIMDGKIIQQINKIIWPNSKHNFERKQPEEQENEKP